MIRKILKTLPPYVVLVFGIIGFQSVVVYEGDHCNKYQFQKGSFCKLIKKTKITAPGRFFLTKTRENIKNIKTLINKSTTSGLVAQDLSEVRERFNKINSGFTFNYEKGTRENAGYLLLSAADPKKDGEPLIELWDLNKQTSLYKWDVDTEYIINKLKIDKQPNSTTLFNPLLLDDGNLITAVQSDDGYTSPLIKLSPKGKILEHNSEHFYHHSIEIDSQDNIFVPIQVVNKKTKESKRELYWNEGFAILNKDLKLIKTYLLKDIYKTAGLDYKLYKPFPTLDPFHLNDVKPLNNDEETNIVLLSLRHQSNIIAYDLKKEQVIWMIDGYGNKQHDVDILDKEGKFISFFDNNVMTENNIESSNNNIFITINNLPSLIQEEKPEVRIYNNSLRNQKEEKLVVNREDFSFLDKQLIPKTISQGSSQYLIENDSIYIEETTYGRLFEYDAKTKKILWEYINRNDETNIYYMMVWSRRLQTLPNGVIELLTNKFQKN